MPAYCRTLRPLRVWVLSCGKPLLIITLVFTAPVYAFVLIRDGLTLQTLLAPGLVAVVFVGAWAWAAIRVLPAARTSAEIKVTGGPRPVLRIESRRGNRAADVLEIPVSAVFCVRVAREPSNQSLVIELQDGRSHCLFRRRPTAELEELATSLNEHLAIPSQEQRIAAWFSLQADRPMPTIEMAARGIQTHVSRSELVIRIPRGRSWSVPTVLMLLAGLIPCLLLVAGALLLSAYVLYLGKSLTGFWYRVGPDFLAQMRPLLRAQMIWLGMWWITALLHRSPSATVTVMPGRLIHSRQRGRRISTREIDTLVVGDSVIRDSRIIVGRPWGRHLAIHVAGTRDQRERIKGLLLEACGLRAPSGVGPGNTSEQDMNDAVRVT